MFAGFARWIALKTGTSYALWIAISLILLWLITGRYFNYSESWQLTINTGTTVVTFLMVFVIQASVNHDTTAIQIKLDELLRAHKPAKNELIKIENLSDDELEKLHHRYLKIAEAAKPKSQKARKKGRE